MPAVTLSRRWDSLGNDIFHIYDIFLKKIIKNHKEMWLTNKKFLSHRYNRGSQQKKNGPIPKILRLVTTAQTRLKNCGYIAAAISHTS